MMSDNESKLPENPAVDIWVESPLKIVISPDGQMTITCYQPIWGEQKALSMNLKFAPDAAGSLVNGIHRLIEDGHITLVSEGQKKIQ